MTLHRDLLVELFVEELPPKALRKLGEAFAGVLFERLKAEGLAGEHAALTAYASPRRLASRSVSNNWGISSKNTPTISCSMALSPLTRASAACGSKTASVGSMSGGSAARAARGWCEYSMA